MDKNKKESPQQGEYIDLKDSDYKKKSNYFRSIILFLFFIIKSYLMASPWKQEFKDFKPQPPPWLSTGRKATPGVDYYDPRKPYKYWIEKEIRNDDVELQKVINGKLTDDVKNRRNRSSVKPRSFPWRCKVYRCEP